MALRPEVRQAIDETMRRQFDMVPITEIEVREDEDSDGDPILRVRMIYDAPVEALEVDRLVSITRHLRARLGEIGEERFPHATFVSLSDVAQSRASRRRHRRVAV